MKAPDWSLGKYYKTVVHKDTSVEGVDESNAPIVKLVDYFKGGQKCDENNQQRATEVHIQCCDGTNYPHYVNSASYHSSQDHKPHHQIPKATLNSVIEPQLCSYQAVVCTPLLCPRDPPKRASAKRGGLKDAEVDVSRGAHFKSYVDFIRQVEPLCLVKAEDWWTYELCFNKGVRQIRFNLEQSVSPEGTIVQKQVLVNQYTLGVAPTHVYKNETALVLCSSSSQALDSWQLSHREQELFNQTGMLSPILTSRKVEPQSLSLGFVNGTPCDLDQVNRSTVVDVSCGPNNQIVSVSEERTCEYRIKVELKLACLLPGFLPEQEKVTVVGLTLVDPIEPEGDEEAGMAAAPIESSAGAAEEEEAGMPSQVESSPEFSKGTGGGDGVGAWKVQLDVPHVQSASGQQNTADIDISQIGDAHPPLLHSREYPRPSSKANWLSRSPEERERARRNIEITLDGDDDLQAKNPMLYNLLLENLAMLDEIELISLTKRFEQQQIQQRAPGRSEMEPVPASPQTKLPADADADAGVPSLPLATQVASDVIPVSQGMENLQAKESGHEEPIENDEVGGKGVEQQQPLLSSVAPQPTESVDDGSSQAGPAEHAERENGSEGNEETALENSQEQQTQSSTVTNSAPTI